MSQYQVMYVQVEKVQGEWYKVGSKDVGKLSVGKGAMDEYILRKLAKSGIVSDISSVVVNEFSCKETVYIDDISGKPFLELRLS